MDNGLKRSSFCPSHFNFWFPNQRPHYLLSVVPTAKASHRLIAFHTGSNEMYEWWGINFKPAVFAGSLLVQEVHYKPSMKLSVCIYIGWCLPLNIYIIRSKMTGKFCSRSSFESYSCWVARMESRFHRWVVNFFFSKMATPVLGVAVRTCRYTLSYVRTYVRADRLHHTLRTSPAGRLQQARCLYVLFQKRKKN